MVHLAGCICLPWRTRYVIAPLADAFKRVMHLRLFTADVRRAEVLGRSCRVWGGHLEAWPAEKGLQPVPWDGRQRLRFPLPLQADSGRSSPAPSLQGQCPVLT